MQHVEDDARVQARGGHEFSVAEIEEIVVWVSSEVNWLMSEIFGTPFSDIMNLGDNASDKDA